MSDLNLFYPNGESLKDSKPGLTWSSLYSILKRSVQLFFIPQISITIFVFFLAVLFGKQDLSSLTRDQTCTPCIGSTEFNHWTTRKSPQIIIEHLLHSSHCSGFKGFPGGSAVKNPPANTEDMGLIPGWGRSTGAENIPAWKIPWTEELGGLQSMELPSIGHNWVTKQQGIRQTRKKKKIPTLV